MLTTILVSPFQRLGEVLLQTETQREALGSTGFPHLLSTEDLGLQSGLAFDLQRRSSSLQLRASEAIDSLSLPHKCHNCQRSSSAQGPLPPQHTSEQPSRNSWGHPISGVSSPALSSSPQETFLSEREPPDLRRSLAAPGGRYRHRYRNPHPPGAVAGSQWPVPVPAPPGRPHPPNLSEPSTSRRGLPKPNFLGRRSRPVLAGRAPSRTLSPPAGAGPHLVPSRRGGAGGGGSGSGAREGSESGRPEEVGATPARGAERAGRAGPDQEVRGPVPPPQVAPSRLAPGRVLTPSPQPFTSEALRSGRSRSVLPVSFLPPAAQQRP